MAMKFTLRDGISPRCNKIASGAGLKRAGAKAGPRLKAAYIAGHLWQNRTGRLEGGADVQVEASGTTLTLNLFVVEYYGWYLEHGTINFGTAYSNLMNIIYAELPNVLDEAGAAFLNG